MTELVLRSEIFRLVGPVIGYSIVQVIYNLAYIGFQLLPHPAEDASQPKARLRVLLFPPSYIQHEPIPLDEYEISARAW